jgi:hypothetical protein
MSQRGTRGERPKARRVTLEPRKADPVHEYDGVYFYPGGQMVITNPNLKHFIAIVQKDTPEWADQITLDYRC